MKQYHSIILTTLIICFGFISCSDNDDPTIEPPVIRKGLFIEPDTIEINSGDSFQLKVKLDGKEISNEKLDWYSTVNTVEVDQNGLITAIQEFFEIEYTPIIAVLKENPDIKAECYVKVHNKYKYRIILKDKGTSDYSLQNPEKYLSKNAIDKRKKRNIVIDNRDLPISKKYIDEINKAGAIIVSQSKWLNTVCIILDKERDIKDIEKLPFVEKVLPVWTSNEGNIVNKNLRSAFSIETDINTNNSNYADSWDNINTNNGQVLHELGYKGQGIDIAIIDAGFMNLLNNTSLDNINIKGAKSFIYEERNPYAKDEHGVSVTSCIATNKPGYFIGTAPEANYWLLMSEDSSSEYPIEEDYWVAAIEYADSIGIDIVSTSLSYLSFDIYEMNYTYEQMDGKTAPPTRAANIAFEKGMFIVCCAGNHASWVGTPSDSPSVLTVGSVNRDKSVSYFSAWGITVDGRVKPDVMALGGPANIIGTDGVSKLASGTSYATPIISGLVACLWQAYPHLTNRELLDIMRKASDRYNNPEIPYGYGITDMEKAIQLAQ